LRCEQENNQQRDEAVHGYSEAFGRYEEDAFL